jgi:hypothetical protein
MHWYDKDGNPKHWVTSKNGTKRATTLRDARKLHLVPSVTSVLDILAKPGLDRWKINKTIEASLALRRGDFEDDDSLSKRILQESKREVEEASQRGVRIHDLLESFFKTGNIPDDKEDEAIIRSVQTLLHVNCGEQDWISEETFTHSDGYGGMIDLHCKETPDKSAAWVIDFKTKEFDAGAKSLAYDSMGYQLAAYREGLGYDPFARIANVFISATNPGISIFHEWSVEDHHRFSHIFKNSLEVWKYTKKYWPEIKV